MEADLKLCTQRQALELYTFCITGDPELTLTYFTARSIFRHLCDQINRRFIFLKNKLTPGDCLPLPGGYIHVYDHYFQTAFSLKAFGQSKPNFVWNLHGKRDYKFCKKHLGHMTKMASMPIYGKIFKNLVQNPKCYYLETWYAVSGTRVLQSLYKW